MDISKELLSERDINMIRGRLQANVASQGEINEFLKYVSCLESLIEDASNMDFYGTEGWRHRVWE